MAGPRPNRLQLVVEHAVPRTIRNLSTGEWEKCGTVDILECGHRVINDGALNYGIPVKRRRCPDCGPLGQGRDQPMLPLDQL